MLSHLQHNHCTLDLESKFHSLLHISIHDLWYHLSQPSPSQHTPGYSTWISQKPHGKVDLSVCPSVIISGPGFGCTSQLRMSRRRLRVTLLSNPFCIWFGDLVLNEYKSDLHVVLIVNARFWRCVFGSMVVRLNASSKI